MTVNLTNMLSTIALIGLLVGPTVGVADGSDAYQACQDMKWKADKQAKKNCFRDLALVFEHRYAAGVAAVPGLEEKIAELVGMLEESGERYADLDAKYEENEDKIAELEDAADDADMEETLAQRVLEFDKKMINYLTDNMYNNNGTKCTKNLGAPDGHNWQNDCRSAQLQMDAQWRYGYQRALGDLSVYVADAQHHTD